MSAWEEVQDKVIVVSLISGQEIIGVQTAEDDTSISLEEILGVGLQQTDRGFAPQFYPVFPCYDNRGRYTFKKEHILISGPANQTLVDIYLKLAYGKPDIAMPSSQLVLP